MHRRSTGTPRRDQQRTQTRIPALATSLLAIGRFFRECSIAQQFFTTPGPNQPMSTSTAKRLATMESIMQEVVAGDVLLTVSAYLAASTRKWSRLPSDKNEDRAGNSITEWMCRGSRISSHCSEHIVEFDPCIRSSRPMAWHGDAGHGGDRRVSHHHHERQHVGCLGAHSDCPWDNHVMARGCASVEKEPSQTRQLVWNSNFRWRHVRHVFPSEHHLMALAGDEFVAREEVSKRRQKQTEAWNRRYPKIHAFHVSPRCQHAELEEMSTQTEVSRRALSISASGPNLLGFAPTLFSTQRVFADPRPLNPRSAASRR